MSSRELSGRGRISIGKCAFVILWAPIPLLSQHGDDAPQFHGDDNQASGLRGTERSNDLV